MKKIILLILLLPVLNSCFCSKITDQKVIKDSIEIEKQTIIRDTSFITDIARVALKVPVKDLNSFQNPFKPIVKEDKNARVMVTVVKETVSDTVFDVMHIEAVCDSIELAAQIKDQLVKEQKEKVITETVVVYKTPKWIWWLIGILMIGIAIMILLKIKPF